MFYHLYLIFISVVENIIFKKDMKGAYEIRILHEAGVYACINKKQQQQHYFMFFISLK